MGGHLGFTFHWAVSIPDMETEFTGGDNLKKKKPNARFGRAIDLTI